MQTAAAAAFHEAGCKMPVKRKAPASKADAVKKQKTQSDLFSGFAAQILKSPSRTRSAITGPLLSSSRLEIDDAIELSSGDDLPRISNKTKGRRSGIKGDSPSRIKEEPTLIPLVQGDSRKTVATQTIQDESSSWLDLLPLRNLADLAVHKKKVASVREWIEQSFRNVTNHTVLILTGPAGVGKTATVETLSHVLDFDIIEWRNPMADVWSDSYDFTSDSLAQKFERFLSISDKYSALDFGDKVSSSDDRRKVIVVEDIPNTFASSGTSAAKQAFQMSIKRYLASPRNRYPLVLIVTETEPRGGDGDWRRSDAMSIRTLMTPDILEARNCTQFVFNEIAPTFITKALARIVDNLPRASALDISQAVLDEVASSANGDLRSAINTLQFISHRFRTNGRLARPRARKKRGEILTLTAEEATVLNIITNREAALGYFHAIGKVVYNKRTPSTITTCTDMSESTLPLHLSLQHRGDPESSVQDILDETSTDIATFLSGIHQNYIASTQAVAECADLMDALSTADALRACRPELQGIIGVAGAMHALPENARRPYTAKLYFPTYKALMKQETEVADLLHEYRHAHAYYGLPTPALIDLLTYASRISKMDEKWAKVVTCTRDSTLGSGEANKEQMRKREQAETTHLAAAAAAVGAGGGDSVLIDDDIEEF